MNAYRSNIVRIDNALIRDTRGDKKKYRKKKKEYNTNSLIGFFAREIGRIWTVATGTIRIGVASRSMRK